MRNGVSGKDADKLLPTAGKHSTNWFYLNYNFISFYFFFHYYGDRKRRKEHLKNVEFQKN